jgi:hypothetical protein
VRRERGVGWRLSLARPAQEEKEREAWAERSWLGRNERREREFPFLFQSLFKSI